MAQIPLLSIKCSSYYILCISLNPSKLENPHLIVILIDAFRHLLSHQRLLLLYRRSITGVKSSNHKFEHTSSSPLTRSDPSNSRWTYVSSRIISKHSFMFRSKYNIEARPLPLSSRVNMRKCVQFSLNRQRKELTAETMSQTTSIFIFHLLLTCFPLSAGFKRNGFKWLWKDAETKADFYCFHLIARQCQLILLLYSSLKFQNCLIFGRFDDRLIDPVFVKYHRPCICFDLSIVAFNGQRGFRTSTRDHVTWS